MMNLDCSVRLVRYEPKYKAQWDEFVLQSKNGVFLFYRDYLEYHSDRFSDFSLLFFQEGQLVAMMPANRDDDTAVSHGGLTFGGIISGAQMTTTLMLSVFDVMLRELRMQGVTKLIYKSIPHIYHAAPAEEDLYALFLHNARLIRRDVSSTISRGRKFAYTEEREAALRQAKSHGLTVEQTSDFPQYMAIVAAGLKARYGVLPVHTAAEMELLAGRFPENIKLFAASRDGKMLSGVIVYETANVAHAQYISTTPKGRALGALDAVMDVLLNEIYCDKPYFDFGKSTAENGRSLNSGLIENKESYGARATVYDFYELNLEM
jgi:hypothetical protein